MIIWQIPGWQYAVAYSPWGSVGLAVIFAALFLAAGIAIGIRAWGERTINHAVDRASRHTSDASLYRLPPD